MLIVANGRSLRRSKDRARPGQLPPCDEAEGDYQARLCELNLRVEMGSAVGDFARIGIAITSAVVARITADDIGYEDALEFRAMNHSAQQISRTIAIEGDSSAVAPESPWG